MNFDKELWLYLLHHNQRHAADAMRRQWNRSIISLSIHPDTYIPHWGMNFEQLGIDTKAVRIQE